MNDPFALEDTQIYEKSIDTSYYTTDYNEWLRYVNNTFPQSDFFQHFEIPQSLGVKHFMLGPTCIINGIMHEARTLKFASAKEVHNFLQMNTNYMLFTCMYSTSILDKETFEVVSRSCYLRDVMLDV